MPQLAFDILARDRASKVFDQVAGKSAKTEQNLSKMGSTTGAVFGKIGGALAGVITGWQAWDKVMVGGFKRLANLDDARKRLDQMGLSTGQAEKLMSELTDSVTGTAFSLDAGANAMTQFVSAGVDLDEVNKRLEMTLDTAAFAQAPLDEIANIFVKIQSQGKLMGEELNMLQERGVPALLLLADAAGVTAEQMREMISRGEIDADRFFDLWEQGAKGFGENNIKIEGAAKSMGDTIRGSLANAETALARLGAEVLDDFVPAIKEGADAFKDFANVAIDALDEVDKFTEMTGLEKAKDKVKDFNVTGAEFFEKLGESASKSNDVIAKFFRETFGVENVNLMTLLADETENAADKTKLFRSAAAGAKSSADGMSGATGDAADALGEAATQADAAAEALSGYQEALKSATDPVFALRKAVEKVTEAEAALEAVRSDSEATTADVAAAEWALFEALTNADSAAHNSELSFAGMNAVLDDMVTKGLISAETAESLRGQIDETREAAEDYSGPYTADLLADIDDPAIRDAKRQLDAVARMRSPKYRAEVERRQEIQVRNRLNALAKNRPAPILAKAQTAAAERNLNYLARPRSTTVSVNVKTYGNLEFHKGGLVPGGGVQRFHGGGTAWPRFHSGTQRLGADEVPAILQTGERVLSRRQTAVFDRLMRSMGKAGGVATARRGGGMDSREFAREFVREMRAAGLVMPRVDVARRANLYERSS